MFESKTEVDKHVENLLSKLSEKEFKSRAYSIAQLYFNVGDYVNCQIYVEQYLGQKDSDAAAYKLLGQALQKMGQKEKALEQFLESFSIDQTETSTFLDICEILANGDVSTEPRRVKFWLEKAEVIFPNHPVTFRLQVKLLERYLETNQLKEAFNHSCKIEFSSNYFKNSYAWYEILDKVVKHNLESIDKCLYQLLLLTIKERLCLLSLTEIPSGTSKSLVESADLIDTYDQSLESVSRAGAAPGFAEFHASLLHHHRGQFSLHAATLLLKRAKQDDLSWPEAIKMSAPLMLMAWQAKPVDSSSVNWLKTASETQLKAVNRWYSEGAYRCSQSGHYLITNFQNNQFMLDEISQCCSGSDLKDKLYKTLFTTKTQASEIKSSHFASDAFSAPQLRLPREIEVEAYECDAQKEYGNSLHHFVWTLLNYENFADFECTLFDMLSPTSCGPETLNKFDVYAFLYSVPLTTQLQNTKEIVFNHGDKPHVLPANITDLLCTPIQMEWWDCAYKFSQNMLGNELTDKHATLRHGIEEFRCMGNHGLHPELLCILGKIFSDLASDTTSVEEKSYIQMRAVLYYSSAIPLLEKLKSKTTSDNHHFDFKEIGTEQLNALLEESKLYVAVNHINESEYEKAIELLVSVESRRAYYHLARAYRKVFLEEYYSSTDPSKYKAMLLKAKNYAFKALNSFKEGEWNKCFPLYSDTQELIDEIKICINKIDPNLSNNDIDGRQNTTDQFKQLEISVDQLKDQIDEFRKEFKDEIKKPTLELNNEIHKLKECSSSFNKSRTSVENNDPCPDFKPIIPLPAEVKVTTGEEDETVIFSSRAILFRFTDKQWKERGRGEMKLLKHKKTGRVRVLMRREQVHKVCANHIITPEMKINPMKNETKAYIWVANDFAEESVVLEKFCIRFKTADIAQQFYETFEKARKESDTLTGTGASKFSFGKENSKTASHTETSNSFAGKDSGFGFVFEAGTSKSPAKSPSDADNTIEEEDCSAHFHPVLPLPEKVPVNNGEDEDDDEA